MTDLSETIVRAERAIEVSKSLRVPPSILSEDLALLLATARRVQAMEASVPGAYRDQVAEAFESPFLHRLGLSSDAPTM